MTMIDNNNTPMRRHPDIQTKIGEGRSRTAPRPLTSDGNMKLIPWKDIWISLRVARTRGNGEMIEVFYDTLFKEAIFDDEGAWAWRK